MAGARSTRLDNAHPLSPAALDALLAALPEPVIVVSTDTRIVAANHPARDLLPPLRNGDLLALSLRDPGVLDGAQRVLSTGVSETVGWRDRVPVERSFDVVIAPLDDPAGGRLLVLTVRDLTEGHRVERMRVDFIANASHELRTPLASLLGFIETLQGAAREDPRARERFLAIMADQARRMSRLVDDLLSLSRIEQTLHLRPNQRLDLGLVVGHVADTLAPLAAERGVSLALDVSAGVSVLGERDELIRVAENLIENAIKYGAHEAVAADGRARIEIGVRASGALAHFSVRDHGPGIAPEHLPRLTERFYRVDAGQSRAKGGTGLGLALVKHILARHRGRLSIESSFGRGALFVAMIPLWPPPPH